MFAGNAKYVLLSEQVVIYAPGLMHIPVIIEHYKHNGGQVTQATALGLGRYYPSGQGASVQTPVNIAHVKHPAVGHATHERSVGVAKY